MKNVNLTLILFAFIPFINCQLPNYVPTNALVGWWPFNGNANDESGNSNHGTVYDTDLTEDRFGNLNSCYQFDVNKYISVNDNNFFRDSNFTISYWFYQDSLNYNYTNRGGIFFGNSGPGSISILLNKDYKYIRSCSNIISSSGNDIFPINNWYHIVLIHNGSNAINKVYVNTELEYETTSIELCDIQSNFKLLFGKNYFTVSPDYHEGKLDDIGVWNRALSLQEIQNLYTSNENLSIPEFLNSNVKLYPNPSSNEIILQSIKHSDVSIQDINGKNISTELYNLNDNKIDIHKLNKGIYFLNIDGEKYKFIKN